MTTPTLPNTAVNRPQPTEEQRARMAALKKFNWLFVYTPILLGVTITIVLIGLLLWGAFSPAAESTHAFISALADITVIFIIIPQLFLCALPTLGAVGFVVYKRQNKPEDGQPPQYGRLQTLFWKIDNLLTKAQTAIQNTAPKVAQPVIKGNAILAYLTTILKHLKNNFTRS
ncbi:MAG: hypothetical protein Kow0080_09000 [Candidatus Promineifilaceae bacterium]